MEKNILNTQLPGQQLEPQPRRQTIHVEHRHVSLMLTYDRSSGGYIVINCDATGKAHI